jgi:hypothetical protein
MMHREVIGRDCENSFEKRFDFVTKLRDFNVTACRTDSVHEVVHMVTSGQEGRLRGVCRIVFRERCRNHVKSQLVFLAIDKGLDFRKYPNKNDRKEMQLFHFPPSSPRSRSEFHPVDIFTHAR